MRRRILLGAGALLTGLVLLGGFRLIRGLAFFQVRRLELIGGRYLTPATVAQAVGVPSRMSVFDNLEPLARKARTIPGVLEVSVSRRLPGTVRVAIKEAEPVALSERRGRLVLLDAAGRVLPFDPTSPAADLPLSDVDGAVTALLARIRDTDPDLFARIEQGVRVRQDVALDLAQGRIWFRPDASGGEIRDLSLVLGLLARKGRGWRELDARFTTRIIVRGSGA